MEKVNSVQEQMGNKTREKDMPRKNHKETLQVKNTETMMNKLLLQ